MVPVVYHSVEIWGKVCGLPIYHGICSSTGWWRAPFQRAERYIVGGKGIDKKWVWQRVVTTERRATNMAKRIEKDQIKREAHDALVRDYLAKKFVRQIDPGDDELIMAAFDA